MKTLLALLAVARLGASCSVECQGRIMFLSSRPAFSFLTNADCIDSVCSCWAADANSNMQCLLVVHHRSYKKDTSCTASCARSQTAPTTTAVAPTTRTLTTTAVAPTTTAVAPTTRIFTTTAVAPTTRIFTTTAVAPTTRIFTTTAVAPITHTAVATYTNASNVTTIPPTSSSIAIWVAASSAIVVALAIVAAAFLAGVRYSGTQQVLTGLDNPTYEAGPVYALPSTQQVALYDNIGSASTEM